jgi:hypothetical protein
MLATMMRPTERIEAVLDAHQGPLTEAEISAALGTDARRGALSIRRVGLTLRMHMSTNTRPRIVPIAGGRWDLAARAGALALPEPPAPPAVPDLSIEVLGEAGRPMSKDEIAGRLMDSGRWYTDCRNPGVALKMQLRREMAASDSRIIEISPGVYGLPGMSHEGMPKSDKPRGKRSRSSDPVNRGEPCPAIPDTTKPVGREIELNPEPMRQVGALQDGGTVQRAERSAGRAESGATVPGARSRRRMIAFRDRRTAAV